MWGTARFCNNNNNSRRTYLRGSCGHRKIDKIDRYTRQGKIDNFFLIFQSEYVDSARFVECMAYYNLDGHLVTTACCKLGHCNLAQGPSCVSPDQSCRSDAYKQTNRPNRPGRFTGFGLAFGSIFIESTIHRGHMHLCTYVCMRHVLAERSLYYVGMIDR